MARPRKFLKVTLVSFGRLELKSLWPQAWTPTCCSYCIPPALFPLSISYSSMWEVPIVHCTCSEILSDFQDQNPMFLRCLLLFTTEFKIQIGSSGQTESCNTSIVSKLAQQQGVLALDPHPGFKFYSHQVLVPSLFCLHLNLRSSPKL